MMFMEFDELRQYAAMVSPVNGSVTSVPQEPPAASARGVDRPWTICGQGKPGPGPARL